MNFRFGTLRFRSERELAPSMSVIASEDFIAEVEGAVRGGSVIGHRKNARLLSQQELEHCRETFEAFPLSIAQRAIRFGSVRDFAAKFSLTGGTSTAAGANP